MNGREMAIQVRGSEPPGLLRSAGVTLPLLVLLALAIRVWCFVGYQGHDDRSYIAFAWMFAHGGDFVSRQIADPWTGRLFAWLPMSIYVRLFGGGEWVLALNSLGASLASVVIVYLLARRFYGERAGVLAGLLMAALPIDVLYGTRAFGDQATGTLCAAALAGWLMMLEDRPRGWAFATGLVWGLAYLSKETAVLMAVPFALILWQRGVVPVRELAWVAAGLALIVGFELLFWAVNTGDPLYRWHATLGSRESFVPPPRTIGSWTDWIPSPIPAEVMRSENTLLDALFMLTTNEEWGLLFYFALPLGLWALFRGDAVTRAVATFLLAMALLLLFLPLHFPNYTLGRDPRHFTALGVPAVLLVASWIARQARPIRLVVAAAFAASWTLCLSVGAISSDISTQRAFAQFVAADPGTRVWTNNIMASDVVVLSGFDPGVRLGVVKFEGGRVVNADSYRLSNPMRAMRPDVPVATRVSELAGQLVALPPHVAPGNGWVLEREFVPRSSPTAAAIRGALTALGVPALLVGKIAPSQGARILLYRAI